MLGYAEQATIFHTITVVMVLVFGMGAFAIRASR